MVVPLRYNPINMPFYRHLTLVRKEVDLQTSSIP